MNELYVFAAKDDQGKEDIVFILQDGHVIPLLAGSKEDAELLRNRVAQFEAVTGRKTKLYRFSKPELVL